MGDFCGGGVTAAVVVIVGKVLIAVCEVVGTADALGVEVEAGGVAAGAEEAAAVVTVGVAAGVGAGGSGCGCAASGFATDGVGDTCDADLDVSRVGEECAIFDGSSAAPRFAGADLR
jgi:hypothetical protein